MQKNSRKEKKNKERGITLIALILTVIIMVILSAISINSIYNMAIVDKATKGVQDYAQKSVKENEMIKNSEVLIQKAINKLEKIYQGLPLQYQQVEYVKGTGKQWIDTKLVPTGKEYKISIDFQITENIGNTWIFGTDKLECGLYGRAVYIVIKQQGLSIRLIIF